MKLDTESEYPKWDYFVEIRKSEYNKNLMDAGIKGFVVGILMFSLIGIGILYLY